MSTETKVNLTDTLINQSGHKQCLNSNSVNRQATASSEVDQLLDSLPSNQFKNNHRQPLEKIQRFFDFNQVKQKTFYQALLSEYMGTLLLVLISTSVGLPVAAKPIPDLNGALVSGFTVATLIVGFGYISGAHINPAVTITFLVSGDTDILRGLSYISIQVLGAISASYTLQSITPEPAQGNLGMTLITKGVTVSQALVVEMIITFILCYTVHAISDRRRSDIDGSKALTVGLVVSLNCLFAGPYTGASMNPARSFGPATVMNLWTYHWVYWVGPISGSLLAAFFYRFAFKNFPLKS